MSSSVRTNFIYKSILTVSTYIIGLITFPYITRVLGVEKLGLVNFVDNTVNYFLLFATMGISILGVRETASGRADQQKLNSVFSGILGMNMLFTIGVLAVYVASIL
ncbi:MAG TPA: oligosaccharide flippase family protein, partial [Candidatus Coprenecus avistercoris]|nr:oligosaccharide flippase family protein [Candidatus Coprenecus avistercoris]